MKCVYLIVPFLHFTFSEFQVVGPPDPLIALAGSDLVLPCSVQPSMSAVDMNINWTRADLKNTLVHVYKDHRERNDDQDPSYRGRTALSEENLQQGNTSLLLSKVRGSDEGKYTCSIRAKSGFGDYTFEVKVEAIGTHPLITVESYDSSGGVSLLCESKGWWPKPDLEWLASNGANVIGVTETDSDTGSFNVKHRITVYNSDSNKFYCRVKQRDHMMEAEIIISGKLHR
ncbi:butyrophilin subfamily 3 member A2-like [Colossoma macropomum]|uniref:butyrophilin subfamily 3 member A2-like n=1 Tax=Colossoma macropomum TaxID=42526 RepID=UPI001864B874|nr:butyrophilin subfamily 3 member A2-like [Colossoma macropomum]